jgi:hypothetical protein
VKKTASKEKGGRQPVKRREVDSQEEGGGKADTQEGESGEETQERKGGSQPGRRK